MNNKPVGHFIKNYDGEWVEAKAEYWDEAIPLYTHPAELTDEEYAGIGLHLFRIGEATSIKDGIRLVKLIVELTNTRKAQGNE